MLLIIFLGLIATLASVCDGCDVGTTEVNNFDWNQFSDSRPWYALWHSSDDIENNLACVVLEYGIPKGNYSLFTAHLYNISAQNHLTLYSIATNWNGTGFDQIFQTTNIWSGRFYVVAIDYKHYFIIKHCPVNSNQPDVYVAYRSQHPDEETREKVMNKLKENNIDFSLLVEYSTHHCQ